MPGLLIPVQYTPVAAVSRCNHGPTRVCTVAAVRPLARRLCPRSVLSRSKCTAVTCRASSGKESNPTGQSAQDFLTVASKVAPFKDVDAGVLRELCDKGQEGTLPSGYKLAEEGIEPTACYVLLHGCFLRSNGEGKHLYGLCAHSNVAKACSSGSCIMADMCSRISAGVCEPETPLTQSCHVAAFQAKAGRAVNLKELLLGDVCSSTVALAAASQVFSIKSAVLKQMLQDTPQLQRILFKDISQQLAASQATSQVSI